MDEYRYMYATKVVLFGKSGGNKVFSNIDATPAGGGKTYS
jgi:hypothetical protein